MLTLFWSDGETCRREVDPPDPSLPANAVWFDLFDPDPERQRAVEAATGLVLPMSQNVAEIESSHQLYADGGAIYLNMPVVTRDCDDAPVLSSLGFVLSPHHIVTLRSGPLPLNDDFIDRALQADPHPNDASHVFLLLLEGIVARAADSLERIRDEMNGESRRLFHRKSLRPGSGNNSAALAETFWSLGQAGDALSNLRDSLVALGRIVGFVDHTADWLPPDLQGRLQVVRRDVASLSDYDNHLAAKTQFLLDATLGFINIQQNHVIKVLAVVGTVGVPPTLIASIYGMNFESMPELHVWFAYPLSLLAIVVSALLPLAWFKRGGWL